MDIFLQLMASGFLVGGVYALIALGFVLIYKATNIINFATGEFMMIGAYIFYTLVVYLKLPVPIGLPLVIICAALLGALVERLILRHMLGQPNISIIMVTIGLSSILMGIAEVLWGSEFRSFPPLFPRKPIIIGDIVLRSNLFYGFLIALIVVVAFLIWLF